MAKYVLKFSGNSHRSYTPDQALEAWNDWILACRDGSLVGPVAASSLVGRVFPGWNPARRAPRAAIGTPANVGPAPANTHAANANVRAASNVRGPSPTTAHVPRGDAFAAGTFITPEVAGLRPYAVATTTFYGPDATGNAVPFGTPAYVVHGHTALVQADFAPAPAAAHSRAPSNVRGRTSRQGGGSATPVSRQQPRQLGTFFHSPRHWVPAQQRSIESSAGRKLVCCRVGPCALVVSASSCLRCVPARMIFCTTVTFAYQ